MVLLDVLIIGGGPHALTLATLLSDSDPVPKSDPSHDSAHSPSCLDPLGLQANPQTSDSKRCRGRKKRRATTGMLNLELKEIHWLLGLLKGWKWPASYFDGSAICEIVACCASLLCQFLTLRVWRKPKKSVFEDMRIRQQSTSCLWNHFLHL